MVYGSNVWSKALAHSTHDMAATSSSNVRKVAMFVCALALHRMRLRLRSSSSSGAGGGWTRAIDAGRDPQTAGVMVRRLLLVALGGATTACGSGCGCVLQHSSESGTSLLTGIALCCQHRVWVSMSGSAILSSLFSCPFNFVRAVRHTG